ncbi:polycystin-1-like protein 3 isoform X3 [Paroedura picta]|uniref:polycystin-1-like protein 3 isoform X3 n=1 Tax=Paroedura picta TaxID=143630 RepID=UPI004055ACB3
MELHRALWLWLWLRIPVASLPWGKTGYRLVRRPQRDFPAANAWCWMHGGSLLHSWDRHTQGFLQRSLNSGSKSWIAPHAEVPRVSEEARGPGQWSACWSIIRIGDQFWARKELCSKKLPFLCQSGPRRLRREASSPLQRRHPCTVRCSPRLRATAARGLTGEPTTIPQSSRLGTPTRWQADGPTDTSSTRWGPTIPMTRTSWEQASSPQARPDRPLASSEQPPSYTLAESRVHLPPSQWPQHSSQPLLTPYDGPSPPGPGPGTQQQPTQKTTSEGPGNPPSHATMGPVNLSPWDVPPEDKGQALEQLLHQFHQMVPTLGHPLALERASQALQDLTSSPALLSGENQAQASHALQFLSTQLPIEALANPTSFTGSAAAASSLFQSLSNLLMAMAANSSSESQQQQREALATTLAALPVIQMGLLLGSSSTELAVTAASPALSASLSSCRASSLPHRSIHVPQPKPLTVTFPSASALAPMLSQLGQAPLQVQVASFALDPFRPLGRRAMAGVASIMLRTHEGPVHIEDLQEEMEIVLHGEAEEVEDSATQLMGSSGQFHLEVNVSSLEDALLVSMRPTVPVRIMVQLASPPHAQGHRCLHNTTLPQASWQEEGAYVWVVPPEALRRLGPGPYSLSAEMAPQPQPSPQNVSVFVSIASTGCYHWDSQAQAWRSHGCRVGPQSTLRQTQCLCSHLSFFGRVFVVVPHVLDLRHMGQLLSRVGQNPVGLALLGSLLLAYGAILFWARQKQRVDARKVRVTVLAGRATSTSSGCYLVQVFTGYRRGAATTAQVVLTLYGAEGQSEPYLLQHPHTPSFETGSMDAFLLPTQQPLGPLHAVRLWHNNSGASPSWFVRRLVVSDLAARKKWQFPCECWLAADMEDSQVDRVFVAASDRELRSFRYLFWAGLVEKLMQEHLWLSVVTCSAWSPFTRVQRLSCCLALLLCSMLINIMFWKGPEEDEPQPGPLAIVTWQDLVVSLEAAFLLIPLHLLIVHTFRLAQPPALTLLPRLPPPPPPVPPQHPELATWPSRQPTTITHIQQELMETVGFLYKNPLCCCQELPEFPGTWKQMPELVAGLCILIRACLQQLEEPETLAQERTHTLHGYLVHVVRDLETQLCSLDWLGLQNPYDYLHALDQLRRLQQQLQPPNSQPVVTQPSQLSSFPMDTSAEPKGPCSTGLPRRLRSLCWLVVGTTGLASGSFTVLYSLQLSRAQATHWASSLALSVLQGLFLMQPLKVLALTLVFSLMRKRELWQDKGQEQELQRALALAEGHLPPATTGSRDGISDTIYRPPPLQPTGRAKERALKEKKLYYLAREIGVQLLFLAMLMVLCYAERSPSEFYLNDALQKTFTHQLGSVRNLEHLYGWAKHTLLPNVYHDSEGFATDATSFLVGSVRLRQIRAKGNPQKQGLAFFQTQREIDGASQDDRGCPSSTWGPRAKENVWAYQSESTLQEYPTRGNFASYSGGGYVADLGRNASHANRVLHTLAQEKWLDRCTQAIFVEFTVYNANVNLFCAVTVLLERNGIGAIASTPALQILRLYPGRQLLVPLACAQLAFLLLLLYHIVVQGQGLKQAKWRHFRTKGNLLDAFSLLSGMTVVGLYVRRGFLAASILRQHRQDRSRFVQVSEMANTDAALNYLLAFLVALSTVKLCNLLHLNPRLHLITRTLQKAWDEVLGFLLTLLGLLIGYAFACNLLFGWSIINFKTFFDSAVTIVGLLAGIFNYKAVIALDPVLGSLLLFTSILSMVFVIINLFVSALLTIFSREMKAVKVSKEESMMQLIQLKISSLLGIKQQALGPAHGRAAED